MTTITFTGTPGATFDVMFYAGTTQLSVVGTVTEVAGTPSSTYTVTLTQASSLTRPDATSVTVTQTSAPGAGATATKTMTPPGVTNVQLAPSGSSTAVSWVDGPTGATYNVSYTRTNGNQGNAINVTSPYVTGSPPAVSASVTMILCGKTYPAVQA